MLDTIIRGGEVVTPAGRHAADVAIAGETIAAIAAPRQRCRRNRRAR